MERETSEDTSLQSLREDAHSALQRCYDLAESLLVDWGEDKDEDTPPTTPVRRRKRSLSLRRLSEIDLDDLRNIKSQMKYRLRSISKEMHEEGQEEDFSRDAARKRATDFATLMRTEIQCVESIVKSRTGAEEDENYKNAMKESKKATDVLEHLMDRQSFEMRRMQTQLEESRNERVADQSKFVRMIRNANIVSMKACEKEMDNMMQEIEVRDLRIEEAVQENCSIQTRLENIERDAKISSLEMLEEMETEIEKKGEVIEVLRKRYQKDRDAFRMRLRTLERAKDVESEKLKKMQYEELRERT